MAITTITRTAWTDDNGTGTTGTIINNAELQAIYSAIDQLFSGAGSYTTVEFGGGLKIDGLLNIAGGVKGTLVTKTTTYAIVATDYTVLCNGTFTVTLPTAVGRAGQVYVIKNSGTGTVTVGTTSAQTIDGATTYPLTVQYWSITVQSDGANWVVI